MEQRDFRLNLCPLPPLSSLPFCLLDAANALSLLRHFSNGWPKIKPLLALLVLPFLPSLFILLESKKLVVNALRFSKSARRFWVLGCNPSVVVESMFYLDVLNGKTSNLIADSTQLLEMNRFYLMVISPTHQYSIGLFDPMQCAANFSAQHRTTLVDGSFSVPNTCQLMISKCNFPARSQNNRKLNKMSVK